MVFRSYWVLGLILAHQTAKFKLSGHFCFSKHPWGPWGRQSSGVICIWKIYQLFCEIGAALADFFCFMKMLPNVSFISMAIKKVFLSVSIATISTLWRHNYGTSQPKFGQCVFESETVWLDVTWLQDTQYLYRLNRIKYHSSYWLFLGSNVWSKMADLKKEGLESDSIPYIVCK